MQAECLSLSTLPGMSALFRDYAEATDPATIARLRRWYPTDPFRMTWAQNTHVLSGQHREALSIALKEQAASWGSGSDVLQSIDRLREGAAAIVTGQQVGLFGGPLLTLLKAATAIRKAQDATRSSGRVHVPVFWLATEDHDLEEVDQVHLLARDHVVTLRSGLIHSGAPGPVGDLSLPVSIEQQLAEAEELLGFAPVCDQLREAYLPAGGKVSLAQGFGRLLAKIFAGHGLILLDAAERPFHKLGSHVLLQAIEHADELETALLARSEELTVAGYHAQVKVAKGMSLLFLLTPSPAGTFERRPLRRTADGAWKAGTELFSTQQLLEILESEPERLSPNALLRPVMQDAILPTAAYVGGPAEIAYFAQSAVLFERLLGRVTPVLPRLSATLVDTATAAVEQQHEVSLTQVIAAGNAEELTVRLGARAMPIELKRQLAHAGNALDTELSALTAYMEAINSDLGRAAGVSGSKMRYQMNRLRRMAARFEAERTGALRKQATTLMLNLYPEQHLQERLLAGVLFLARFGDDLPATLIEHAGQECPGHRVLYL